MSESKLFFGGVPVGPDVDLLERTFPDLKHERVLTHDELSAIIGYSRPAPRYWSVMKAWKDRLRDDRNIELSTVRDVGYRVMTNAERVDSHINKAVDGFKTISKAGRRIAHVPREDLPSHVKARADYAQLYISKLDRESSNFRKTVIRGLKPVPPPLSIATIQVAAPSEQQGDENAPI